MVELDSELYSSCLGHQPSQLDSYSINIRIINVISSWSKRFSEPNLRTLLIKILSF